MKWMLTIILVLSFNSFAKDKGQNKEERFAKAKARVLEHFDKKIQMFQEAKACASGASDKAALKECRRNLKSTRQSYRKERKEWKKMRKEKRKERRQNKED